MKLKKTSTFTKIIWREAKWQLEKTIISKKFDVLSRKWEKVGKKVEFAPLSEHVPPLTKTATIKILIRRQAVDTFSLKPLVAFFTQTVKAKIPSVLEHEYLSVFEGRFFLHELNMVVSQGLSVNDSRYVKRIKEPTRISNKQAVIMLKDNATLYEEQLDGTLQIQIVTEKTRKQLRVD